MAIVTAGHAALETQSAFDNVAATYDQSNTENVILWAMRDRARAMLERFARPGVRLLDLGCGPGTDDIVLARRGYAVTAVDSSAAMVSEAKRRVHDADVDAFVRVERLGIDELDRLAPERFDVAYSNFGALNCVHDLAASARGIAERLHLGGIVVASVIGRVCPWEVALYIAKGDWRRATIRYSRGMVGVPLEGRTVWMRYYSPRSFALAFAPAGFRVVAIRALGLVVPPPYMQAFAARHPGLINRLMRIEDRVAAWPGLRSCGDHFLMVLRRT